MSRACWALTAGLALLTAALAGRLEIPFEPGSLSLNVVVAAVFAPVALVYTYHRFDARIAGLCDAVALLATFTLIAAVYTYVMTIWGAGVPLWDARLFATDRAVGLDWRGFLAWLDGHATIGALFEWSYGSILKQLTALLVCLVMFGQIRRLQTFVLAAQVSLLVCGAAPAFAPALGPYGLLHIVPAIDHPHLSLSAVADPLQEVQRLRGAAPVIRLDTITGIVTFPSFHAVLVVLFAWAFWSVPVMRWVAVSMDAAMLCSTPLSGSHYFADIGAGLLLGAGSIALAKAILVRLAQRAADPVTRERPMLQPSPRSDCGLESPSTDAGCLFAFSLPRPKCQS